MVPSDSDQHETLPLGREGGTLDGERERDCEVDSLDLEADAVLRAVAYAPPRRVPNTITPGMRWGDAGRYIIERKLGHGGMGTVYAATDSVLGRVVALKVLDLPGQDATQHAQLLREAQLAARVEHERIARVYDVGTHEGLTFVAMEYIPGGTLRQWMTGRHVPLSEVIDVALQIAEGLSELHGKGVVHRDLKPENVGMTKQGGIKLLDFGLARYSVKPAEDLGLPARGDFITGVTIAAASGTPGYMAPEQYEGKPITARVDVFAFGVILHELITGERLFPGATIGSIMDATLAWTPVLRGEAWDILPLAVRELAARMLARDPDARFEDGGAVLGALCGIRTPDSQMPTRNARLPAAVAQSIGKAQTQQALPLYSPRRLWSHIAARGVEIACALTAVVFFFIQRPHHQTLPTRPGQALIDVGSIDVGRDFVEVVAECHQIGAGCDASWIMQEAPRSRVTVPPFYLDQYEVTNEQYAVMLNSMKGTLAVAEDDDYHYPRFVHRNGRTEMLLDLNAKYGGIEYVVNEDVYRARPGRGNLPVAQVSWYGADMYCKNHGQRLPTEDEWEAAARGRDDRPFPWGTAAPRCNGVVIPNDGELGSRAGCPAEVSLRPTGSATQDVTPEGVHDLAGSLSEWTSSAYVLGARTAQAARHTPDSPRVLHGGSWAESFMARTSGRSRYAPAGMGANIGFRCAADAVKKTSAQGSE